MYKPLLFFYCCCFAFTTTAQNLLLNGDFEEFWECPTSGSQMNKCKYVFNPCYSEPFSYTFSTPDFYNCAYYFSTGVDFIKPYSGKGYSGIFLTLQGYEPIYSEYIQLKLSQKLKEGEEYYFSFYARLLLGFPYSYTTSTIGVKFVSDSIVYEKYLWQIMDADWKNESENYLDAESWTKYAGYYTAKGEEEWMIIGNFCDTSEITCKVLNSPYKCEYDFYVFIDNCAVEPSVYLPNVFTPNNDGINDQWLPKGIKEGMLEIESIMIYNRWGELIFNSKNSFEGWDGNCNGQLCSEGTYFATVLIFNKKNNSMKKLSGSITLLR